MGRVPLTGCFPFFLLKGEDFMRQYSYDGPVMEFETCVANRWKASTYAVSDKKAKSNLAYQYKKKNNKVQNSRITLPGNVVLVR